MELIPAAMSVLGTATLATVGAIIKWRDDHITLRTEFIAHKKNVENTFDAMRKELAAHEERDQTRHEELLNAQAATRKEIVDILLNR